MRRLRLKLLFVVIIVLGLTGTTVLPAQAADYFISENKRTISSPNGQQSQAWHIQVWGRGSSTGCYIYGRNLMDTFRGPGYAFDYLRSVYLKNEDTGASSSGPQVNGEPPVASRTGTIFMRGVSYDVFTVRGTAQVKWSTSATIGGTGVNTKRVGVSCFPTTSATGKKGFRPRIDSVQPAAANQSS